MSDNNDFHPSYAAHFNVENMPSGFSYVGGYPGRPGTDRGFSGQAPDPRYPAEDNEND